jgi:uncharacterized membrane protein YeaQ/YmgE (transglycosylase-associated protein family)
LEKLVKFVGATAGGYAGWWLGENGGLMTAFFLSIIGTALGVYLAQRWAHEYLS